MSHLYRLYRLSLTKVAAENVRFKKKSIGENKTIDINHSNIGSEMSLYQARMKYPFGVFYLISEIQLNMTNKMV